VTSYGLQVKLTPANCITTQRYRHPIKCLAQGHYKQTCWLDLHTIPLMLNIKKGRREAGNTNFKSNPNVPTARWMF